MTGILALVKKICPRLYWIIVASKPFMKRRHIRERIRHVEEAKQEIAKLNVSDEEKARLAEDYRKCWDLYTVNWTEYYNYYKFPQIDEKKRAEYISCFESRFIFLRISPVHREIFFEKDRFLTIFAKYIHRDWLFATPKTPRAEIDAFLATHDVIAKPATQFRGIGVMSIRKDGPKPENFDDLFNADQDQHVVFEERIEGHPAIQEFHPESLNTMRVITVQNKGKAEILAAALRTGNNGACVDNACAGGTAAHIDIKTGTIDSPGIDPEGNLLEEHPYSGKKFRGFVIPHWDKVVATCLEAATVRPEIHLVGWDVAVRPDGTVEFVEGNCPCDFKITQAPRQIGLRSDLHALLNRMNIKY